MRSWRGLRAYREVVTVREPIICDVHDCTNHAFARVYPTYGRTDHTALRCREHLQRNLAENWFRQWRQDIKQREPMTHAQEIAACPDCSSINSTAAEKTMEAVLIGNRNASDVFCAEHQDAMNESLQNTGERE